MVKLLKLIGFISIMALSGCEGPSGGGTEGGDGTNTDLVPGVNLIMSISSTGEVSNTIPVNDDARVEIYYLDGGSRPISNEIINISATSGTLSQTTVLTDSDGFASVTVNPPVLTVGTAPGIFTATPATVGEVVDVPEGESAPENSIHDPVSFNYEFVGTTTIETPEEAATFVSSLQFLSASSDILSLKGTGGVGYGEISNLVFKVVDNENNPIAGVQVNFTLTTTVGGLALSTESSISNDQGEAFVNVLAGDIPTPVRVTASVTTNDGSLLSVQSDLLTVTTGIPDQNSFSISVEKFAPEAWNIDGETVGITARLADRFNNPVPDGTVVNFTTEGGVIDGSCQTTNGGCSVTWSSQDPRPLDHRSSIIAYAIGNETYYDKNGSGTFDDGDTFHDLGEVFRDDDELGTFNPHDSFFSKDEKLIDYDENFAYSPADGNYNGVPCNHSTACPDDANNIAGRSNLLTNVRDHALIVMASSSPDVSLYEILPGNSLGDSCLDSNGKLVVDGFQCQNVSINFTLGLDFKRLWVLVEDTAALCKTSEFGDRIDFVVNPDSVACLYASRQSAPTGSSISVATKVGELSVIPYSTVPNQIDAIEFVFVVRSSGENEKDISGELDVVVTTPKGSISSRSVTLFDPADPAP